LKTEAALQAYLKRQAKAHGILWRKIKFEGQRGCPDILLARGGKVALVELKSPSKKGRLSELQKRQIEHLTDVGIAVHVTDDRDEIDEIIRSLAGS
jgi:hypothetical protein